MRRRSVTLMQMGDLQCQASDQNSGNAKSSRSELQVAQHKHRHAMADLTAETGRPRRTSISGSVTMRDDRRRSSKEKRSSLQAAEASGRSSSKEKDASYKDASHLPWISGFFLSLDGTLKLGHLSPHLSELVDALKSWVNTTYAGPDHMIFSFDDEGYGFIRTEAFAEICRDRVVVKGHIRHQDTDYAELAACCDLQNRGIITCKDLMFLETEHRLRDQHEVKMRAKKAALHNFLWSTVYSEEQKKALNPKNRLAIRPWQARDFEHLPRVQAERRRRRKLDRYRAEVAARTTFLNFLQSHFGSAVRAWRMELDPKGTGKLNLQRLRQFCIRSCIPVDSNNLWRALDRDRDHQVYLEELDPDSADVLANLKYWAEQNYGSVLALWQCPQMAAAKREPPKDVKWSSGASEKKLLMQQFFEVLDAISWPLAQSSSARKVLLSSLDKYNCGFVSRADLEWLSSWKPPEWICADPDDAAWEEMRSMLVNEAKHVMRAWRLFLDMDNSNVVSWQAFRAAAENVGFKGNVAGSWRSLDRELTGFVSLVEFDRESADLLYSLKEWAETHFGNIVLTFHALDEDCDGHVSYFELKRACQRLRWGGDVYQLFQCLDIDMRRDGNGRRSVTLREIQFLDEWSFHAHICTANSIEGKYDNVLGESRPVTAESLPQIRKASLSGTQSSPSILSMTCSSLEKWRTAPKAAIATT